jgi:hypothetical protein
MGEAVVDGGNPFAEVAKSVAPDRSVSDGPAGSASNGYTPELPLTQNLVTSVT